MLPQNEIDRLEKLRLQLSGDVQADSPAEPPKPPTDPAALLDAFDQGKNSTLAKSTGADPAPIGSSGKVAALSDPMAQASVPSATARNPAKPDLWPQLSRCWRPAAGFPTVKLVVNLDQTGSLAEPPSVVRDTQLKADRNRLRAEGEAIRAVIACAPYLGTISPVRSLELEFAPKILGSS